MTKPKKWAESSLYNRGRKRALKDVLFLIEESRKYYPLSVFPEIEPGCAVDRYSASMARHMCDLLHSEVSKLLNTRVRGDFNELG